MSLKKALEDCLIDFDRRIMVTDLLEEYKLTYDEVNATLEEYVKKQEPATKFEKRFLVHGKKKRGSGSGAGDELYTVVQESKLQGWLAKLQDAQTQLYSVEIAGGSKTPAPIFKPMQHSEVKLAKLEQRAGASNGVDKPAPQTNGAQKDAPTTNGVKSEGTKALVKSETAKSSVKSEPSKSSAVSKAEKASPEAKKSSPKEQDSKTKPGAAKKGSINSFFSAAPAASNKQKDVKATPSKAAGTMDNFFKKQPPGAKKSPPEKNQDAATKKESSTSSKKKSSPTFTAKKQTPANTSVQLFDEESAESSDEEEKMDKLRRKVIGSDDEAEKASTSKRRRISDSEDEEQPTKKPAEEETVNVEDESMDTAPANETFLDDEGFVITQRKPTKAQPAKKKISPKKTAPASATKKKSPNKKTPPSASKGGKDGTKTKQADIKSFFSKK